MYNKPFYISTIKDKKKSRTVDYIKAENNGILTPFGVVKPILYRENNYSSTFNKTWNFFFSKFLDSLKLEMNSGMTEIIENISSFIDVINYELPVIGAFSGSNNSDHIITFNILEEFLNCSGQKYTIFLDHEKIGLEGLTISKILENIWFSIKNKCLDLLIRETKTNSLHEFISERDTQTGIPTGANASKSGSSEKIVNKMKRTKRKCSTDRSKINCTQLDLKENDFHHAQADNLCKWLKIQSTLTNSQISKFYLSNNNNQKHVSIIQGLKLVSSIFKTGRKNNLNIKPIIILFPSSECLAPGQLGQFLEIISQIKETYKIPFITILGISSNILYSQQIIGQTVLSKLKLVSVKLLDSKKVFFRSVINSLLYLDDFTSNIFFKGDLAAIKDMIFKTSLGSDDSGSNSINHSDTECFPFPLLSAACIKQIKDIFFQHNYSLTFSLKTIFVIFQLYFSNNSYDFFFQKIKEINLEDLAMNEHVLDRLKVKYQIDKNKLSQINNELEEAALSELNQLKLNLDVINLGLCIINIIYSDFLNIFDLNERYNLIFEWLEVIEKNSMKELTKKISNLTFTMKNARLNAKPIFSKINDVTNIFMIRNGSLIRVRNQIFEKELVWNINTFEANLFRLFTPSFDDSKLSGYISDNVFHSLIHVHMNNDFGHLDYFLDEVLTPNFISNIINEFEKDNHDISDDFSLIYKIYNANKGNKINMFKLFTTFCNEVIDDFSKCSDTFTSINKVEEVNNVKLGVNFLPDQYNNLFGRFVRVINTFQFIGLIYLPLKNTKGEQENVFQTNIDDFKGNKSNDKYPTKYLDHYFKFILSNTYAHKLYWGNNMPIIDMRKCDNTHEDAPKCHTFNDEKIKPPNSNENTNPIEYKAKYKRKTLNYSNTDGSDNDGSFKKRRLEVLKLRAAELNQKKIIEFKGIRVQKTISSVDKLNKLRCSIGKK